MGRALWGFDAAMAGQVGLLAHVPCHTERHGLQGGMQRARTQPYVRRRRQVRDHGRRCAESPPIERDESLLQSRGMEDHSRDFAAFYRLKVVGPRVYALGPFLSELRPRPPSRRSDSTFPPDSSSVVLG